jgi:hypothetical protein
MEKVKNGGKTCEELQASQSLKKALGENMRPQMHGFIQPSKISRHENG